MPGVGGGISYQAYNVKVIPFWILIVKWYPDEEARFQEKMQRVADEMRSLSMKSLAGESGVRT